MRDLHEGMKPADLVDLVLPIISIDEYVSKVDPEQAIVIGFYVHDKDAANDLNRFIQKSAVDLLDTEVSPAPDQHGYYIVFVEFMNDDKLGEEVEQMVNEVSQLVASEKWQIRARGHEQLVDFSAEALNKMLSVDESDSIDESAVVLDFLKTSDLCDVRIDEQHLVLQSGRRLYNYEVVGLENLETFLSDNAVASMPVCEGLRESLASNRLQGALGPAWNVHLIGEFTCIEKKIDQTILILRDFSGTA